MKHGIYKGNKIHFFSLNEKFIEKQKSHKLFLQEKLVLIIA